MEGISRAHRHAFTTDAWTSLATENYVTTTCHYIDPTTMTLENWTLDTKIVTKSHTGEHLAAEMRAVQDTWKLKEPVAVTDNAANALSGCEKAEYPHFGCFAHTMNLAVNRCLGIPEVSKLVGKCRKIVAFFKMSPQKTAELIEQETAHHIKELKMIQDVATRWNSALAMCRRIIRVYPAVFRVLFDHTSSGLILSEDESNDLEALVKLLEPFEEATVMVSSSKNPTASLIMPMMAQFQRSLAPREGDSRLIQKGRAAILSDLNKRYTGQEERRILGIVSAVDPRFKSLMWMSADDKAATRSALQEEAMAVAATLRGEADDEPMESANDHDTQLAKPAASASSFSFFDDEILGGEEEAPPVEVDCFTRVEKEMTGYSSELKVSHARNPVAWWQERLGIYPILARVALRHLMIPATSVPSERVFILMFFIV